MVFSNDLIKSILEDHLFDEDIFQDDKFQCGFDELVEGVTVELNAIADTERRLRDITVEERMLTEEHEKACDELQTSRNEIISQCRHLSTTCQTDKSTTCDTCGKEV